MYRGMVKRYSGQVAMAGLMGAALLISPGQTAAAASQTSTTATRGDDGALKSRVHERFEKDSSLSKQNIDIDVEHGMVTLKGTVRSNSLKARAGRFAKVAGVSMVHNELVVDPKAEQTVGDKTSRAVKTAGDKTGDALKTAGDKTGDALKTAGDKTSDALKTAVDKTSDALQTAGEKTKEAVSTTGEKVNDGFITTKIHANFVNEPLLKGSDIDVTTNNHVVTLKGTVASPDGSARAVEIARTTTGVENVVNQLVVGPAK